MECPVTIERIRAYFNDPKTVEHYVRAVANIGLWDSEKTVFKRWIDPEARVLDLGCGTGRIALGLWKLGYRNIEGADLSENMVTESVRISECLGAEIRFSREDATRLRFEDERFQAVIFGFNGLMQIPGSESRREALEEIRRVLVPGGLFVFTTLDRGDPMYRTIFSNSKDFDHDRFQNPYLLEEGDRHFKTSHGTTFMHVPRRREVMDDLKTTGWTLLEDKMRSELSRERSEVEEFAEDCRFWVAKKPT